MIKRFSNIELCRIFSILLVLLVHSAFASNGWPEKLGDTSIGLILLESFTIIGVNVFVFISGYFSIKLKPKTIYNLIFACGFYFIVLSLITILSGEKIPPKTFLFISSSHYFILDYMLLTLLSPLLNTFVNNSKKEELRNIIILLLCYQTYFGFIPGYNGNEFDSGYSVLSFSIIYLIARYIYVYGISIKIKKYSELIYILSSILIAIGAYLILSLGYKPKTLISIWFGYNNPIIILSSICFFLIFEKRNIEYNKFINHIAKSTLAVLLFHASKPASPIVWKFIKNNYVYLNSNFSMCPKIFFWILVTVIIFAVAVIIDQIRLILSDYTYDRIKNKISN